MSSTVSEDVPVSLDLYLLGAIPSVRVYRVPYCLTPLNQLFYPPLDILCALPAAVWVDFDSYLFEAKLTDDLSNAGLQEHPPVECHCRFHGFGENGVSSEQRAMR
jgi:hypothetical protein